jgi:superfamily II DNA or RNA helicase
MDSIQGELNRKQYQVNHSIKLLIKHKTMDSYVYILSSQLFSKEGFYKIGYATGVRERLSTYLTGCPPGFEPSVTLEFYAIYKIKYTSRETQQGRRCESMLHDRYCHLRCTRNSLGDSEWFHFNKEISSEEIIKKITEFVQSQSWFDSVVDFEDIRYKPRNRKKYLQKYYKKNFGFIENVKIRNEELTRIQQDVIKKIQEFLRNPDKVANILVSPCGSGKTRMISIGIIGIKRIIICVPNKTIQLQWVETLEIYGKIPREIIHCIGEIGITDDRDILKIFSSDTYCIVSTYASSDKLVKYINSSLDILVLDEAHHMAGVIVKDDPSSGEGKTRRLLDKAIDLGIKRLSSTYTPKYIRNLGCETSKIEFLSMNHSREFGEILCNISIRELIQKGILPDYCIWALRDLAEEIEYIHLPEFHKKAYQIIEAWKSTEWVDVFKEDSFEKEERPILHHLIIFVSRIEEISVLEEFFSKHLEDKTTKILGIRSGDDYDRIISDFEKASRAILINCKVLGEGVNIVNANSVCIMYPKKSRIEIIQMLLRAGRWSPDKSVFHILVPLAGEEDTSSLEEVLISLASTDNVLAEEIASLSRKRLIPDEPKPLPANSGAGSADDPKKSLLEETMELPPDHIQINMFGSSLEEIHKCFRSIHSTLTRRATLVDSRDIQDFCREHNIHTSTEYLTIRKEDYPDLPEDPRWKGITWFDYLNIDTIKISPEEFVNEIVVKNTLLVSRNYTEWREKQPTDIREKLPSIQNINDGYFGEKHTEFSMVIDTFQSKTSAGRRGRR